VVEIAACALTHSAQKLAKNKRAWQIKKAERHLSEHMVVHHPFKGYFLAAPLEDIWSFQLVAAAALIIPRPELKESGDKNIRRSSQPITVAQEPLFAPTHRVICVAKKTNGDTRARHETPREICITELGFCVNAGQFSSTFIY
jgi:hypothetical protein